MQVLEFLASITTIIGIFLYNKQSYYAPLFYISACVMWMGYSLKGGMYYYFVMNLVLWCISMYNLDEYSRKTRLKKEEIDE